MEAALEYDRKVICTWPPGHNKGDQTGGSHWLKLPGVGTHFEHSIGTRQNYPRYVPFNVVTPISVSSLTTRSALTDYISSPSYSVYSSEYIPRST